MVNRNRIFDKGKIVINFLKLFKKVLDARTITEYTIEVAESDKK